MEDLEIKTRIKEVMLEKNIPLVKLSQLVGIEKGNMSAIVNGKGNPTLKTLFIIANALGANITELFEKPEHQPVVSVCPHCDKPITAEIINLLKLWP